MQPFACIASLQSRVLPDLTHGDALSAIDVILAGEHASVGQNVTESDTGQRNLVAPSR